MFKYFAPTPKSTLDKCALAHAQVQLHEAKLNHEAWTHTLALQTARVNRLKAEIADDVNQRQAFENTIAVFPPLDFDLREGV